MKGAEIKYPSSIINMYYKIQAVANPSTRIESGQSSRHWWHHVFLSL